MGRKKSMKRVFAVVLCLVLSMTLLTACGSEEKKAMKNAVKEANVLIEKNEQVLDPATKDNLVKLVEGSKDAKDDDAYKKVADDITAASKAYEDSIKQLKQVTSPSQDFVLERVKTVDTVTDVEAATEENDQNKKLNKPGGYTAYIAMKSSMIKDETGYYSKQSPVEAGNSGGGAVEVYANVEDAEKRNTYLSAFDGAGMLSPGGHKVVGTLVVRTSDNLTASQQKELEQNIINALTRLD